MFSLKKTINGLSVKHQIKKKVFNGLGFHFYVLGYGC